MTNRDDLPETVAVPVELLKKWEKSADCREDLYEAAQEMRALIPKPKPRLVAVDLDWVEGMAEVELPAHLDRLPDLLTLLDSVLDGEVISPGLRASIRHAFCAALGMFE